MSFQVNLKPRPLINGAFWLVRFPFISSWSEAESERLKVTHMIGSFLHCFIYLFIFLSFDHSDDRVAVGSDSPEITRSLRCCVKSRFRYRRKWIRCEPVCPFDWHLNQIQFKASPPGARRSCNPNATAFFFFFEILCIFFQDVLSKWLWFSLHGLACDWTSIVHLNSV